MLRRFLKLIQRPRRWAGGGSAGVVETVGVGAMPLAETEPTARVATSKASKTWRDNAKTEGHYKRKKREENVVIAFRKRFLWHALDPAVRKAKEPRIGAKEPKLPSSTGDISFDEGEWASLEARAKSSANARIAVIKREIAKERLSEMSDGSQADDIEVQSLGDDPNDDPIETDKRKSEVFDELETRPFVHANANDDATDAHANMPIDANANANAVDPRNIMSYFASQLSDDDDEAESLELRDDTTAAADSPQPQDSAQPQDSPQPQSPYASQEVGVYSQYELRETPNGMHRGDDGLFAPQTPPSDAASAAAAEARHKKAQRVEQLLAQKRCSTCDLREGTAGRVCRCDHFPLALPNNLAFGDCVECAVSESSCTQHCVVLYFAPAGTVLAPDTRVYPWKHGRTYHKSQQRSLHGAGMKLLNDMVVVVPIEAGNIGLASWRLYLPEQVTVQTLLINSRVSRAPSRYEPERLAASRLITAERRRECYDKTLGGQHRCFSCLALLCFTLRDEVQSNVAADDAGRVRCHEAGHVFAHSLGGPDELWNLVPLCHACNGLMRRNQAFDWIEKLVPDRVHHEDYTSAKDEFVIQFATFKIANPELFA